ncbi:MAG: Calx-beta domain-containing protein [Planctomycetota bacterium]
MDTVGNSNAILTLPLPGSAGSLGNNKNITIDTVLPYIRTVSAPSNFPDGTYSVGQTIPITVTFSEPVSVTGTPRITLETNGIPGVQTLANVGPGQRPDAVVDYVSGGGTTTLTFLYTVGVGDNSPDLDALILTLSNGALIRDFAQNNLQGGVPNFGSLDFPLPQGGSAELLLSVQNTANVPGVAQITDFSVSNTVIVEGERYSFIINANGFNYQISYFAQKDDTAMIVGQFLRQQIGSFMGVTAASFNNGRGIRLTATNPGVPFTVSSLIVTPVSPAPVASGSFTTPVITRANGLPTTQVATITVNQQGPGLIYDLTINGTTLTYQASGTDTLTTVATALRALIAGNVAASNVVSVSGSGTDIVLTAVTSGTPFVLSVSHSLAMNRALVVDTAPIVTNVTTTTADGIYAVGDAPIDISVTFSEPVHVNPGPGGALPTLILATGGTNAIATYVSGSNTNTLVFRYTIAPGETTVDLDYASTGSLLLNGATIQDLDASPADLNAVLPAPGTTGSLSFNKTIGINSLFNDPPVIIAPTSQTIIEDVVGGLVFSAANGNQIQLADVDAGPGNVLLDITAYNGILTFATTFGLTFQNSTANGSSHIVLQGSLSALNQALQGLKYTPAANANSLNAPNARIVIVVDDQGNAGTPQLPAVTSSTKTIPITITPVNDLPVASDKTVTTGSGTPITIILESIDVDGGAPSYSLDPLLAISLRTQHGTLTPIFGGNSLTYTPDPEFVGVDNFIFTVNDGFGNSAIAGNITINVVPVVSTVGFPDVSFPEGNVTNAFPLTVTLNQTFAQDVTITYTTVNGTAVAGTDYEFQTGTVTIPAGQLTGTISINVTGNNLDEPNKTFSVVLSNPVNAVLQDTTAVVTIQNDDGLSIDDVNQFETDSGDTVFTFTVTLSSPQAQTVTVNYATSDGTASRLSDYASAAGILTFLPGQTSKTISITVHGDTTNEGNETFFVDLSNAVGGSSLGKTRGVGTILNDDEKPLYSIGDAQVSEGNAGTKVLSFVVNLSAPSGQTVTVNYSTADLTAGPNSATAGSDYQTKTGILTFLPGQTSQTITITIFGDQAIEENESFLVNLTGGVNADPAITTATGTIVNDDGVYTSNMEIFEGNNGITYMVFTVNAPVGSQNLIVNYSTSAGTATAGVDYTDVSGQLVFTGGVTSRTISVPILGDYAAELDETFFLQLSYAQPGPNQPPLITPIVVGTIKNDDQLRTITSSDVTIVEGNSGTKNAVFTLTLSAPIGVPVTIDYTTVPGTATAGSDYVTTFGTATFQPNQTVVTISVPVIGDLVNEDDETFTLQLSNPTFATFLGNNPVATITDTDNPPSVIFNGLTLNEGQVGSTQATLTVNLSSASGKEVTMGYRTIDGTAVSTGTGIGESDFNAQQGTLTFQPGETSQTITITINGDATYELFENFVVELFNIVNATSNTSTIQRTVTIENDDPVPTVFINDVPQDEGDAVTPFVFTLTLLAPSAVPVTVNYATGSFTAQSGSDFDAATGTVTFNPGETTKTITVNVKGDLNVESDEEFYVNLSPGANVNIGRTAGKGTIVNDDFPPTFSIQNVSINEGDSGPTIIEFVVKRTGSLTFPSSVNYSTSNGTATAGLDYLAKNGTVSFGANIDEVKIQILVTGDLTVEPDEIFFVNLTNPVNGTIPVGQGQAQGTIRNDDNAPPVVSMPTVALSVNEDTNLTITGISVSDPDAGAASIAVTLSAAHGTLVIRTDAANGLGVSDIANNGTNQVTLTGSIAEINATLASLNGVVYRAYTDYSGSDSLTVLANDLGHSAGANVPKTDTKIVGINVINVNDAPVITYTGSGNSNPAPIASTKGATVAAFGSPNTLTVTDPDNQNFNGGTITVSNLSQISSKDKLAIRNQGKGAGLIGLKGKNITYGGVVIGTFSGGTKGAPLVITLNGSASAAATTALLKNITFGTPKAKVSPTPRTLSVTLSDGKGATSTPVTTVINVTL